jgi:hypothetical protein
LKTIRKTNITVIDPTKPKRGKSGFLYFCEENRGKIKEKFPTISVKQIVSKLGTMWQELKNTNLAEIKRYENMSLEDRNRYKEEMKDYVPILNRKYDNLLEHIDNTTKSSKDRRKKKYRKSSSPYSNFVKSKKTRAKRSHPELDSEGLLTYLEKRWEKLSDEKKGKYLEPRSKSKSKSLFGI